MSKFVLALACLTAMFVMPQVALAVPGAIVILTAPKPQVTRANNSGACYNIADSDARTYCLARERRDASQCYTIQRGDLRSQCLAEVKR